MIAGLAPGEERTFARSILAARSEGRKLQPISNTRLLSPAEAESIARAIIDIRLAAGESITGAILSEDEDLSYLTNKQIVESAPSILVEGRVSPVVIRSAGRTHLGLLISDRLFERGRREDQLASGSGAVAVIVGPEIPFHGEATLRLDNERSVIKDLTAIKTPDLGLEWAVSAPLLYPTSWERGSTVVVDLQGPTKVSFSARRL
ncbi:MAG: hypothetical protein EBU43_07785 [Actinobacteria bacterium]|nr:hypothetical protein [Actinomycetota bacterium]